MICDPILSPGQNSPNISNRIVVFLERGEDWFWYNWKAHSRNFSPLLLIFFDFGHLQGKTSGQSWTKSAKFGSVSFFMKTQILHIFFKQCFCLLEYYLWWEFWQCLKESKATSKGIKTTACKINNFPIVTSTCPKYYRTRLSCSKNSCGEIELQ